VIENRLSSDLVFPQQTVVPLRSSIFLTRKATSRNNIQTSQSLSVADWCCPHSAATWQPLDAESARFGSGKVPSCLRLSANDFHEII